MFPWSFAFLGQVVHYLTSLINLLSGTLSSHLWAECDSDSFSLSPPSLSLYIYTTLSLTHIQTHTYTHTSSDICSIQYSNFVLGVTSSHNSCNTRTISQLKYKAFKINFMGILNLNRNISKQKIIFVTFL